MNKFKRPKTNAGDLRHIVEFYKRDITGSSEPNAKEFVLLYTGYAEIYNASIKDIESTKSVDSKTKLTLLIRDTKGQYVPSSKHYVKIPNSYYSDTLFNISKIEPDFKNSRFIKIIVDDVK